MAFDILGYLESKGRILSKNQTHIAFDCPFCLDRSAKHRTYFYVCIDSNKPVYHCFRCGAKGTWTRLVSKLSDVSIQQAKIIVGDNLNLRIEKKKDDFDLVRVPLPEKSMWTKRAIQYLESRRVSREVVQKFGLYFCGSGRYSNRIIIPVRFKGEDITFQARSVISDVQQRYLSPMGSPKDQLLYNYDEYQKGPVYVVEGPFDVIRLYQLGVFAVASFGKRLSDRQIDLLRDLNADEVFLMYDNDALSDMDKVWFRAAKSFNVRLVPIFEGDPGDFENLDSLERIIDSPYQLMDFKMQKIKKGLDNRQFLW